MYTHPTFYTCEETPSIYPSIYPVDKIVYKYYPDLAAKGPG